MDNTLTFTRREEEIIRLAAQDKGRVEIAAELGLCSPTCGVHLRNIYAKIGISGRGAGRRLTTWARANGYGQGGADAA